jgi:hypothetical protein
MSGERAETFLRLLAEAQMREVGPADKAVNDPYTHPLEQTSKGRKARGLVNETSTDGPILFPCQAGEFNTQ